MKLCVGPKWEQTRTFLLQLVSQAAMGKVSPRNARTNFILHLRDIGYLPEPDDWRTIDDLKSDARLGLILDTNIGLRMNYRNLWSSTLNEGTLYVVPAWKLVQFNPSSRDWPKRWRECGGTIYGDRMIALINDPVWYNISAFPFPFSPFDFDESMSVTPVGRVEVVALGLLTIDTEIAVEPIAEPTALYYFDALPDGRFLSMIPPEYGQPEEEDEECDLGPQVETKFMKVAEVGTLIKDRTAISREEGDELLKKLAEAVTEGLDNHPDYLALAYRYTGEIYDHWNNFDQAFEYYGYALQFDSKVGVKKRHAKLAKQLGKTS